MPRLIDGKWRKAEIGAIARAKMVKQALRDGTVQLEETYPVIPTFKGHKHQRERPMREAAIAAKMEDMPKRVEEHKRAVRLARREFKERERRKNGLPPYPYPLEE
eukprot:CAMPEP_0119415904 /NCGR_PEP_ID=MMETSP1335-20130426/10989_1 /TAXON_ID=259385 /ORGANISM="Chrysoculter rhomboideus, Strain RCC1486" /LENGTH=104 /DNA_ID=CAMNT_0007440965 /DNA_START=12 /DNA_END=326 /DNA_ORIENTATION=-